MLFVAFAMSSSAQVIINEIMYHPSSENVLEEYIELHNRATTNVNVGGWRISGGVDFTFPSNTTISANGYLVVAAHRQTFAIKYPGVANVVGDWIGVLSNTRNDIDLDDRNGTRVDTVEYADEGDWAAVRQRGPLELGHRGWIWYKETDGLGKSLELINPALPNEHGQNWAPSIPAQGTPGAQNSVRAGNIAPLILNVQHFPFVPASSNSVSISARVIDDSTQNVTVTLQWRVDSATPPAFSSAPMFDDGAHGDGLANDGLWAAMIPAQPNNAVVEFYVRASDAQSNARTWPAPARDENGIPGQFCNALYQVDNDPQNTFGGVPSFQPVYKMIMTEVERAELAQIPFDSDQHGPNAQMNGTFISLDGNGTMVRHLVGIRNRGHASRRANPPNYRVNFRSDELWQDVLGINLNSQFVHVQHLGSILANRAGSAGNYSRAAQVRVNNLNRALSGAPMWGSYAANEVYDGEWAERHFPDDGGGNIYKAVRDINPPDFDYRTETAFPSGNYSGNNFVNYGPEDKNTYTNSFYKETNVSEDDWTDLIGMLRVMGINGIEEFTEANVRRVINVEQWLTHLAVMAIMGNAESGLNDGHNDDYYMYRGINDPRFILMHHDLDQILGVQSRPTTDGLFGSMNHPPRGTPDEAGVGLMMQRFLGTNYVFRSQYLETVQRLLNTTFSETEFNALADQTLGSYVTPGTINNIKNWMTQRRTYLLQNVLTNLPPLGGVATITGEPRSPTPSLSATLLVGGSDIVSYRFRLNNGSWGGERPVTQPIVFNNSLANGSTNTVYVIGRNSAGGWQNINTPTASKTWVVNTAWPTVRLNEVLARNDTAVNHNGTFPDMIELYNEGTAAVDLTGMRFTDDPAEPSKYTFPAGTTLAGGAYLALYANNNDGTPGIHLGFSLNDEGDGLYLFSSSGVLLDSVEFGVQLPDRSVARVDPTSGAWFLSQPSEAGPNNALPTGDVAALRINEWLAAPQSPFVDDFIEIVNFDSVPVNLGGLYLTDTPIGAPTRHRIPDLTFVPGGSYFVFTADGDANEPRHVGFQLSTDLGEIALIGPGLTAIDCVYYGPQRPGISAGRCPDGSSTITHLVLPTPGSPNACPVQPPPPQIVPLITSTGTWRMSTNGVDLGTNWIAPTYNDSAWPVGTNVIGFDIAPLADPIRTQLPFTTTNGTRIITYYFRTTFNVPAGANLSGLVMEHAIDDGAAFYLNGREVLPRFNLPQTGLITYNQFANQNIGDANAYVAVTVPLSYLQPGINTIAVELHNGTLQQPISGDVAFGLRLSGIIVTNTPSSAGVRINEILANNGTVAEPDGSTPDWVEFYNPADTPVDLSGMSLSDSTLNPDRFVFPNGSLVSARSYHTIRFDADRPASATNTGFGLNTSGDNLYLFNPDNSILDFVIFGLQAADFSIGRFGPTDWRLCNPSFGSTNLPAALGDVTRVRINEWMADPPAGEDDWFELYNPNAQPVAIGLCWLSDDLAPAARQEHQIPALSFIGAITNAWQRFECDNNPGADHVSFNLSRNGDNIAFSLPNGTKIDDVTFGAQVQGISQGRLLDGQTNIVSFPGTPSPGDPNYILMNNVAISEALTHSDPPFEDAIEIQNLTGAPLNVSGWWLSDSRGSPRKYQIPAGTLAIPPFGFRVFYEYQFNSRDDAPIPFSLSSANGDEVYLSAATNSVLSGARAQAEFGPAENGVSFGRYRTSQGFDFVAMERRSFGVDNPSTVEQFRTGAGLSNAYPKISQIVITEVMYHPTPVDTNDNVVHEFVEVHNRSATAAFLYDPNYPTNTWRLRGGVDLDFPPSRTIAPGGYLLVVSFDPANNPSALASFQSRYGNNFNVVGPYSGKLDNGGEAVRLLKPDPPQTNGAVPYVLADHVIYSDTAPWPTNADGFGRSLQRVHAAGYGNDPTNWLAAVPTPGPPGGLLDSDGDGMPDSWEDQYSLRRSDPSDADDDPDGDGMTNLQEYLAGTDPRQSGSSLRITAFGYGAGSATLQFNAVADQTYTLQYRNSLGTGAWTPLTSIPASSTNGVRSVSDPGASSDAQRFYRITTP